MASAFRPSASSAVTAIRGTGSKQARALPRNVIRYRSRRSYAHSSFAASGSGTSGATSRFVYSLGGVGVAALLGGSYIYFSREPLRCDSAPIRKEAKEAQKAYEEKSEGKSEGKTQSQPSVATFEDYQKVYDAIASRLEEHDDYEDGSYGPVILRLAWHASGTYDAETGTGGSNGATMRFDPESEHGANNGLKIAREFLEPLKTEFPWISYSDLWTLAGVCAVQEMQGPTVPWRPGRSDQDITWCAPEGRLPDGSQEQNHLRRVFGRMGFSDREIVALSGAHALGRCHTDRSGFDGPWTFSPTVVTNDYFRLLVDEGWHHKDWDGEKQWEDDSTKSLMMLPTDMALVEDSDFLPYVKKYAESNDAWFEDFSKALCKLFELGVPFETSEQSRFTFKPKVFD